MFFYTFLSLAKFVEAHLILLPISESKEKSTGTNERRQVNLFTIYNLLSLILIFGGFSVLKLIMFVFCKLIVSLKSSQALELLFISDCSVTSK